MRGALVSPKAKHHAAVTTAAQAGALLRAIDGYDGQEITAYALKLSAHLFVRPGELRKAEWTEIDGLNAIWSIPAEKMKRRRPHRVPLSVQALDRFDALHDLTGTGKYVFPSVLTPTRPMSENTVNSALRRLGFAQNEMTAHGFRAMPATLLNEMGLCTPTRSKGSSRMWRRARFAGLMREGNIGRSAYADAALVGLSGQSARWRRRAEANIYAARMSLSRARVASNFDTV